VNLLDRFILTLYSLSLLILSLVFIAITLNLIPFHWVQWVMDDIYHSTRYSLLYTLAGVIFFIVSLRFLFSGLLGGRKEPHPKAIRRGNEFGATEITLDTLESLATRAAKTVRGIRELKTYVRPYEDGAMIKVRTYVDGEVPIPSLIEQVQQNIKEHVEQISGVRVYEVTVLVSDVYKGNAPKGRRVE
jgi:uncharacterized alkaline shock family protein YloU